MSTTTKKKPSRRSAAQKKTASRTKYINANANQLAVDLFLCWSRRKKSKLDVSNTFYREIQEVFLGMDPIVQMTFEWYYRDPLVYKELNPLAHAEIQKAAKKALELAKAHVIENYKDGVCYLCGGRANVCGPRHAQGMSCG